MNRGKLVIVIILGVALVAAAFSTWYRYRGQHRAHDFWGTSTALLIADAPQVKAYQLGEAGPTAEDAPAAAEGATPDEAAAADLPPPTHVEFHGYEWKIDTIKDAQAARGINNVRTALVLDMTYDFKSPAPADEPDWRYALAVNNGKHWATLLFDFDTRQVALAGGKKTILLDKAASADLRQFFAEVFPDQPAAGATDRPSEQPAAESQPEPAANSQAEPGEAGAGKH
jgi:hypothetical protein